MIEHEVEQGSEKWHALRLGRPTASNFHRILSPKRLQPSSQRAGYMYQKLAERLLGVPMDMQGSGVMARGSELEEQAVRHYEFVNDVQTRKSGFFTTDDGRVGCSVDRLVGDEGILEVKCPLAPSHIAALLGDGSEHFLQCQGQMWIAERQWCDLVSYFPGLPASTMRIKRSEDAIDALRQEVMIFCADLSAAENRLREMMD